MIPLEEADNLDDKELSAELQIAILVLVQAGNHPDDKPTRYSDEQ